MRVCKNVFMIIASLGLYIDAALVWVMARNKVGIVITRLQVLFSYILSIVFRIVSGLLPYPFVVNSNWSERIYEER